MAQHESYFTLGLLLMTLFLVSFPHLSYTGGKVDFFPAPTYLATTPITLRCILNSSPYELNYTAVKRMQHI